MKIKIENKEFYLKVGEAIQMGVLKEIKQFNISVSSEEAAILLKILGHVGGPPSGARGISDNFRKKLLAYFENGATAITDLDLSVEKDLDAFYFKN